MLYGSTHSIQHPDLFSFIPTQVISHAGSDHMNKGAIVKRLGLSLGLGLGIGDWGLGLGMGIGNGKWEMGNREYPVPGDDSIMPGATTTTTPNF